MRKRGASVFVLLLLLGTVPLAGANGTTTVSISPSTKTISVGESFTISIVTTPAQPITGVQVVLHFDTSILSVEDVTHGDLLGSNPFYVIQTDNENGEITIAGTTLGGITVSATGTFATVTFHAGNVGNTTLTLENVMIVTVENGSVVELPYSSFNGNVTVQSTGPEENENTESSGNTIVYDDFNDGELGTNLGGMAGPMSPGGTNDPTVGFTSDATEGAYALALTYDFPSGQWCGYWSYANDGNPEDSVRETIDVSSYSSLKFYLKGASGGEKFKIELTDPIFDASSQESYLATQSHKAQVYVQATTAWQDVEIPLSEFTNGTDLDLTQLRQINIVFDRPPRSGTVYLDTMRFTGTAAGGPPENQPGPGENQSNAPPIAYIDFIEHPPTVYENTMVVFSGHGVDPDGTVVEYLWTSSIDGPLSTLSTFDTVEEGKVLSPGTHQIRFKVRDDEGLWSDEVTAQLTVTSSLAAGGPTQGSEQGSTPAGEGFDRGVVILLGLEAAAAAALVSFIAAKKFGYLKPAINHISRTQGPAELVKPTVEHISVTEAPVKPMKLGMEHIPEVGGPRAREAITPRVSLRDLKREVYSPEAHKYRLKEQMPEIPREKWGELQTRLKRLMNSRKKLM